MKRRQKRYPEKVGFTDSGREADLCGGEAARKGHRLLSGRTGKQTHPVAILIDKKVNCIDTMLGALYAGDFYVVVDVHSPADRIENILGVLDDLLVVTDEQSEALAKEPERGLFPL